MYNNFACDLHIFKQCQLHQNKLHHPQFIVLAANLFCVEFTLNRSLIIKVTQYYIIGILSLFTIALSCPSVGKLAQMLCKHMPETSN